MIATGTTFRAQLQDTLSGVTYDPTILDITSSGQGASRWKQLCFKVRTADLQDFDHGSTIVAFPSKEFVNEVQQALIDTKVYRFALFLTPGVPYVLDIGSDTRFECVNLLPGKLAFRPELRGSIKATAYQETIRIIFFNCRIGTSVAETLDGQEFMTIPPFPTLKQRCFTMLDIHKETNATRLQMREEAKRENNKRIERLGQIAAHAGAAVKVAPNQETPILHLADVPSCVGILEGLEFYLTTTRKLPTQLQLLSLLVQPTWLNARTRNSPHYLCALELKLQNMDRNVNRLQLSKHYVMPPTRIIAIEKVRSKLY
jgi:hypothetical protein